MLRFDGAGVSDVGRMRRSNDDSGYVGPQLALVADGVGGAPAGDVASALATDSVVRRLADLGDGEDRILTTVVDEVDRALADAEAADPARAGMGSTLSAVVALGGRAWLVHIGDSRAYRFRDGALTPLTRDHTFVQRLVDDGELTADEAATHPWRNVLTRSVHASSARSVELADIEVADVRVGDRVLLCTDGLTDQVGEERIAEVLEIRHARSAAAVLVRDANLAGGMDNVTAVVVDLVDDAVAGGPGEPLGAYRAAIDAAHGTAHPSAP